jgi:hypothetical protein
MTLGTITVGVGQTTDQAPPPPPPPPSELASFLNQIMPRITYTYVSTISTRRLS